MNTFLRRCCTGILFGGLLVCEQVQAQEFRLGFVKTDLIFKEANSAKTAQTKLEQEFSQRDKDLIEQANRVIKQVAEAENYDLVLQDAVYVDPRHDITGRVVSILNAPGTPYLTPGVVSKVK